MEQSENKKETIEKLKEINQDLKNFLELTEFEQDFILEKLRKQIEESEDNF